MANWSTLKAAVASVINANGNQAITGQLLQNVLNNIITNVGENATFVGVANPDTAPGAPDGDVFYIAGVPGNYSNFNGVAVEEDEVAVLIYKNAAWSKLNSNMANVNTMPQTASTTDARVNKMITELYLEGLDKSKVYTVYRITNGNESRSVLICDSNISNPDESDIQVALAWANDFSKDIIEVEERGNSGVSGWVVVNWDAVPKGEHFLFGRIRNNVVSNLANSPRIAAHIHNKEVIERKFNDLDKTDNLLSNEIIERTTEVVNSSEDSIIPPYTQGYGVNGQGSLFEGDKYAYYAPIELKKNEAIILNNGNTFWLGQNVSILYQCDKGGNYVKTLVLGNASQGKVIYTNNLFENIYVGISCEASYLQYKIIEATTIKDFAHKLEKDINHLGIRLERLDGCTTENITIDDIGIRRYGYYINMNSGIQLTATNSYITNSVYLRAGDLIEVYTGGSGHGVISKSLKPADNNTVYEVIKKADNITSPIKYEVESEGYYSFSGQNAEQGINALTISIRKEIFAGIVGEVEKKVNELYDGKIVKKTYTQDDLLGGALVGYYLHNTKNEIFTAENAIITEPIYLRIGDKVECSTGGTGFALFAKSPSGSIDRYTTGFENLAGLSLSFNGIVQEDGWYVFSGRINRTDGTNLTVYIEASVREKNVYELLEEKANKSDVGNSSSNNTTGFALSIGADSVKSEISITPWFDEVEGDGTTYGTYLDDKIDSVPQGDSFIFISDVHYSGNKKHSAKLIDYVRRRLGIKTIIHGGDVLNESPIMANAAKEWLDFNRDFVFRIGGDFKQVCGDHDHNGRYASEGQALSYQFIQRVMNGYNIKELTFDTLYDEQIKEVSIANSWTEYEKKEYDAWKKMHYYFDDSTINTRFVVLHTGWTGDVGLAVDKLGSNVLSEANALYLQMEFLYESLITCPNGYNIVVVGHNVVGNKSYTVNLSEGTASRYNVNEVVWKGAWRNVARMIRAYKSKKSITLSYTDWSGEGSKSKSFDFTTAKTPNIVFCIGGDVHWDILGKSTSDSETLMPISEATSLDKIIVTEGSISSSDILHALTMTDGADRGYKAIIAPPADDYNDETDSALASNPNTDGTLDAQAFDIITISGDAIYFTRIGSGKDRIVRITD